MTIRLRYHLALLPLFLGLAAASVGLHAIVQSREIAWGLAGQAQGRALCLAAFLDHPEGGGSPESIAAQKTALARFAETGEGLNVQWFVLENNNWHAQTLFESPEVNPPPPPNDHVLSRLQRGEPAALHVRRPEAAFDESIGYAAVDAGNNAVRTVVAVAAKDTITRVEQRSLVRVSALFASVVLLLGLIVTEFLVRCVRGDIDALSANANALASGDYSHVLRSSPVRELDDLGSTLQSIGSILLDSNRRNRRTRLRFLRAEQMPGEEEVAAAYQHRCSASSAPGPDGGPPCAIRRIGHGGHDEFWGARRTPTSWHVTVGRLQRSEEAMPPLQRIVRAQAARDHVLGRLGGSGTAQAWQDASAVFSIECGESVSLNHAGRASSTQIYGEGRAVVETAPGVPNAVGTLSPASLVFVREYLRQFPQRRLDALADEMAALLAERDSGVLILYQSSPSHS